MEQIHSDAYEDFANNMPKFIYMFRPYEFVK